MSNKYIKCKFWTPDRGEENTNLGFVELTPLMAKQLLDDLSNSIIQHDEIYKLIGASNG